MEDIGESAAFYPMGILYILVRLSQGSAYHAGRLRRFPGKILVRELSYEPLYHF
jgi:hypothetical protein